MYHGTILEKQLWLIAIIDPGARPFQRIAAQKSAADPPPSA
jgi:hypothetical protein